MKRFLTVLLIILTVLPLAAGCSGAEKQAASPDVPSSPETGTTVQTTGTPSAEETTSDVYVDDYIDVIDDEGDTVIAEKTHEMLETLPSSFSLVGTRHLPPIDDQGGIGSCASEGITYMQFTNAVSRYIESTGSDPDWDPSSGNERFIFAPKFTYNFAGAGTAWVYEVLKDHGALPLADCHFATNSYGRKYGAGKYDRQPETLSWPVGAGELASALDYRVTSYEQIWTNTINNQLTTSDEGKALLYKIKDAVVQGNVVVTGGFSSNWQYATISSKDAKVGTGVSGEKVCYWCNGNSGGHQVAIFVYDDDLVCTCDGVRLKGAFLVANSWGDSWMNDGYFWVMYDSVNKVSEHEELNVKDRVNSMDQFCFIYWEKDIAIGKPDGYVTIELTISNREGFHAELTKTDVTDVSSTYLPALFNYGINFENVRGSRDTLDPNESYLTFSGHVDTGEETGYITLGYQGLLSPGESFDNYMWGVNLYSDDSPFTVHRITLYNASGEILGEIVPSVDADKVKTHGERSFVFDLGKKLNNNHDVGSYRLKNTASGSYISAYYLALKSSDDVDSAVRFDVTYDPAQHSHVIKLGGDRFVLDITGRNVEAGKQVQFNAPAFIRETQTWKVVRREDGTYNIRLACDTSYAMGMVDGKIVLVTGKDIPDYGTWIFEKTDNPNMHAVVRREDDGKLYVTCSLPKDRAGTTVTVAMYSAGGDLIETAEAVCDDAGDFRLEWKEPAKGAYLFTFVNERGAHISASYYLVVG